MTDRLRSPARPARAQPTQGTPRPKPALRAGIELLAATMLTGVAGAPALAQSQTYFVNGTNGTSGTSKGDSGSNATSGGTAVYTNQTSITATFTGTPDQWFEVGSVGGNGGSAYNNAKPTDNPDYDGGVGGAAGAGGAVTATNQAAISITTGGASYGGGTRLVAAISAGGNGGAGVSPAGGSAQPGGAAGTVSLDNEGAVSLTWNWTSPPAANLGAIGIIASSEAGSGAASGTSQSNGGAGGNASTVSLTQANSLVTLNLNDATSFGQASFPTPPIGTGVFLPLQPLAGAAVVASSRGGSGGTGFDRATGGTGGSGGNASLYVQDSTVAVLVPTAQANTWNALAAALLVESTGGAGGSGGAQQDYSNGGAGGGAGSASLQIVHQSLPTVIQSSGWFAPLAVAASVGGAGGAGTNYQQFSAEGAGGNGGAGGSASTATVTVGAGVTFTSLGGVAPAVSAISAGGQGGAGGLFENAAAGYSGSGGNGGSAAAVSISFGQSSISTAGSYSPGILAQSVGGSGGSGGYAGVPFGANAGKGGDAGDAGTVTVTVASGATIATAGTGSAAIIGYSQGGNGGNGGSAEALSASAGLGGAGGAAGAVSVTNAGVLSTTGQASQGILAESLSGSGGAAGSAGGGTAGGSGGGNSGAAASTTVSNATGQIGTTGQQAIGILAMSIAGGGGAGSDATGAYALGGSGGTAAAAGSVTISGAGTVSTQGDLSHGIVALSAGGGGGVAGNASSSSGIASIAVGGTGGGGGAGGSVDVSTSIGQTASIQTTSSNAAGLVALSVGGGGGSGGAGYATSYGVGFGASAAVGGSGGNGGAGGAVTVSIGSTAITTGLGVLDAVNPVLQPNATALAALPVDSYGIVALSVGGGGGIAGSALAKTYVLDMPIPETDSSFGLSGSYGVGGTGGSGGNGGPSTGNAVQVDLPEAAQVLTYGNGAHAILAGSIGGGGGAGGDSSATSSAYGFKIVTEAMGRSNYNLDIAVALGGEGGVAGNGEAVMVTLGGIAGQQFYGPTPVSIQTLGDDAFGVAAFSVGGGGGNAGLGSGSTQNGTAAATALQLSVGVGAQGGGGGQGGPVSVYAFNGTQVSTAGDTAIGILATSIGGGGGASTGGSYQLGLPSLSTVAKVGGGQVPGTGATGAASSLTIKAGTKGGTGGDGGAVTVSLQGTTVTTQSEAATGVLALSVGGGGGLAGSAGSSGSSDNPTILSEGKSVKKFANEIATYLTALAGEIKKGGFTAGGTLNAVRSLFPTVNVNLSFGASGGAGGTGGAVAVSLDGSTISTAGDYAKGVVAQSVGGGGGTGGAAIAGGSQGLGNIANVNFNVAMGGSGGSGGDGGAVSVGTGGSSISTAGFGAFGLMAQSVGGGGGDVGSAEDNAGGMISLGASGSGTSTSGSGSGGAVTLSQIGTSATRISTAGDGAHAILLQSIGGGGGTAGQGYTPSAAILQQIWTPSITFDVGGAANLGNGGAVGTSPGAPPLVTIATTGANAYGIFAQSVGGGGGLAFQSPGKIGTSHVGGGSLGYSDGGAVSITLQNGSSISTSGAGSYGIFAQSVGGGGGVGGYGIGAAQMYVAGSQDGSGLVTYGNGGDVTVSTGTATILTTGGSAFGIFAQSVGAGGGVRPSTDGASLLVGTTGAPGSSGSGGAISIAQAGTVSATGENAVAIFAESVGQTSSGTPGTGTGVQITVNGAVQGGSGLQGVGIAVWTDDRTNGITVGSGGSVSALSGVAIQAKGYGITNVQNGGLITGSVLLSTDGGTGTLTNGSGGTWQPAGSSDAAVLNAGLVAPLASNGYAPVTLNGSFTQTGTGRYRPNADFVGGRADVLTVTGNASLAGTILPAITTVLPNIPLPVMTVQGTLSGLPAGGRSTLFGYGTSQSGNQVLLSATSADFTPAGLPLSAAREAVANHLQSAWEAGGTPALGGLFALLGNTADASPSAYAAQLQQLSPNAAFAPGARALANAGSFANATLSCPGFQGTSAMLVEGSCGWMRATGRTTSQTSGNGIGTYTLDGMTWQIGGQKEVAPGFLIGGSLAYEESWLSSSDGLTKGNGQAGYGALTAKYQTGPWLFAASAFGGAGQFNTERYIGLPGYTGIAKGSPDTSNVGVLLRAAYTVGTETLYLRPNLNLSVVHVSTGSYAESGAGALNLSVSGASQTVAVATPMLELGGRVVLGPDLLLRPYAAAGMSLQSTNGWSQTARLASAPAGASGFTTTLPIDPVAGRVAVGVQLYTTRQLAFRLQYDGEFSGTLTSHAGSFVASIGF